MNIGLKLWSNNADFNGCSPYFNETKRLYAQGIFDFIELYVVPNTVDTIPKWKTLKIPFTLHAPHFMHGVNLASFEKQNYNLKIFEQVRQFSESLNVQYTVIHGGLEGNIDETVRQLKKIPLQNMLIENKPYIAPLAEKKLCRGSVISEIHKVINEVRCGFCLDIGHAICAANSLNKNPYDVLNEFNTLNPTCYHLSDNFIDSDIDKHLHFGQGNYDFKKIFGIINLNKNLAIETQKNSKENLNDFIEDVKWIRNLK